MDLSEREDYACVNRMSVNNSAGSYEDTAELNQVFKSFTKLFIAICKVNIFDSSYIRSWTVSSHASLLHNEKNSITQQNGNMGKR